MTAPKQRCFFQPNDNRSENAPRPGDVTKFSGRVYDLEKMILGDGLRFDLHGVADFDQVEKINDVVITHPHTAMAGREAEA